MIWIAPSKRDSANGTLEISLWDCIDQFWTRDLLLPRLLPGQVGLDTEAE
jgi:hypothetical protein